MFFYIRDILFVMLKSVSDRIFLFDVFCENNIILGMNKFFFLVSKFYDFENVVF